MHNESSEQKAQRILFRALKQVIPTLTPNQVTVEENPYEREPGNTFSLLQMAAVTGHSGTDGVQTLISIGGHDLGHERWQQLHDILADVTGVWNSYSNRDLCFMGSAHALATLADTPNLDRRIKDGVTPIGRQK